MNRTTLIVGIVLVALLAAAGVAYAVIVTKPGATAQVVAPSSGQPDAASSPATPAVPPPDPLSPKHTSIPGCVCHSDDPKLVEEHAEYRLNQCFACHNGEMPTGQE